MALKTFGLLLLQMLSPRAWPLTLSARCWTSAVSGQVKRKAKRPGGMLAGRPPSGDQLCGLTRTEASRKKDTIKMTNNLVSIERGARDLFVHLRACCGTFAFPVLTFSPRAPHPRALALSLVQAWLLVLLRK